MDPHWVCVWENYNPSGSISILYSPVEMEYGVSFFAPQESASGILVFGSGDTWRIYNWSDVDTGQIMPLPEDWQLAGQLKLLLYDSTLTTNDPLLDGATHEELWSMHGEDPWLIHKVRLDDADLLFHDVNPLGGSITDVYVDREGYNTTIDIAPIVGATYDFYFPVQPGPDCLSQDPTATVIGV